MRSTRRLLAAVESSLPALTRREWGALAVAAAARAGLEEPDLASLRTHLRDQFAIDVQTRTRRAPAGGIPPTTGRLRPRGGAA